MKRILVVGHQIPASDRSHGDQRSALFLKILNEGNEVYYFPLCGVRDRRSYAGKLKEQGVRVMVSPAGKTFPYFRSLLRTYDFDTVLFETHHDAAVLIFFVPGTVKKIVCAHELNYLRVRRESRVKHDKRFLSYAMTLKEREKLVYRLADRVIAISEYEKNVLSAWLDRDRIRVVPLGMEDIPDYRGASGRAGLVFLANYYHRPNPDAVRYFIKDIQPLVRKKIGAVEFRCCGYGAQEQLKRIPREKVSVSGYVKDIHDCLARYKVFVCPLRYGAGVKKKIADAMANGLPVVTTSVGAEGLDVTDGVDILIADTPGTFAKKVAQLYADPAQWDRISANAYAKVKKRWGGEEMRRLLLEATA